jgi:hypothetical protein
MDHITGNIYRNGLIEIPSDREYSDQELDKFK